MHRAVAFVFFLPSFLFFLSSCIAFISFWSFSDLIHELVNQKLGRGSHPSPTSSKKLFLSNNGLLTKKKWWHFFLGGGTLFSLCPRCVWLRAHDPSVVAEDSLAGAFFCF
jgi:hypothetical protein